MATSYSLHQRDPRSRLFDAYDNTGFKRPAAGHSPSPFGDRPASSVQGNLHSQSASPYRSTPPIPGPSPAPSVGQPGYGFPNPPVDSSTSSSSSGPFRIKSRHVNASMIGQLEDQPDEEVTGMMGRVAALLDISNDFGDRIQESNDLINVMMGQYNRSSAKLKMTMSQMLDMAAATGVGWKVWLSFLGAIALLFWYTWL